MSVEFKEALKSREPAALAVIDKGLAGKQGPQAALSAALWVLNKLHGSPSQEVKHTTTNPVHVIHNLLPPEKSEV